MRHSLLQLTCSTSRHPKHILAVTQSHRSRAALSISRIVPFHHPLASTSLQNRQYYRSSRSITLSSSNGTVQLPEEDSPLTPDGLRWKKMRSWLQFITTPTADTKGTTLVLHFDNKTYLIGNLAEGTQRASIQQGVRLLKVTDVFLTGRSEWSNLGGLVGMILTLADAASSSFKGIVDAERSKLENKYKQEPVGFVDRARVEEDLEKYIEREKPRLALHGARNLNYLLATARRFVFRHGMPVNAYESLVENVPRTAEDVAKKEPVFQDENIKVWSICVAPSDTSRPSLNGAKSPRKRSFDQMHGVESTSPSSTTPLDDVQSLTKAIVKDMFDSDWNKDKLFEVPLSEVKMPSTIFIRNNNKLEKYTGPVPGGKAPLPDIKVLIRKPWPGALIKALPPTTISHEAVSYIIRNHPQRGKFDPELALSFGLTDKRLWGRLTKGEPLQNDKGETITPEMVMGESKEGGAFAIVDIPSVEYVQPIVSRPEWGSKELMAGVKVFVWILGPKVAGSPELEAFMKAHSDCKHVVSSIDYASNRLTFDSAAESTIRLSTVDPVRYVMPHHDNSPRAQLPEPFHLADRGFTIDLEPSIELKPQSTAIVDESAVKAELSPTVAQAARSARDDVGKDMTALNEWASRIPNPDAEIITLGTGSAIPSKYRNVSGTLVKVPGWGNILLDCGENTLGQLKRVFGPAEFEEMLKDLRMIWISHMHADHHLGTASVIRAWYETVHGAQPSNDESPASLSFTAQKLLRGDHKRLAVVADWAMVHWLWEYSQMDDFGYSRIAPIAITSTNSLAYRDSKMQWFAPEESGSEDPLTAFETGREKEQRYEIHPQTIGLSNVQAVAVDHCHGARAVSITLPSGFKVSYSGDCRPSKIFSTIGRDSTVCIHEATFDDELSGDAQAKKHSTTSEALSVASGMNAKACVLTHFSQRYQKVPVLEYTDEESEAATVDKIANASDGEVAQADEDTDIPAPTMDMDTSADEPTTAAAVVAPDQDMDAPSSGPAKTTIKLKTGTDMKVCVAFDYMRVKVGEIAQMEKFTPALLELFADEERRKAAEKEKTASSSASAQVRKDKTKTKTKTKGTKDNASANASAKQKSKRNN